MNNKWIEVGGRIFNTEWVWEIAEENWAIIFYSIPEAPEMQSYQMYSIHIWEEDYSGKTLSDIEEQLN